MRCERARDLIAGYREGWLSIRQQRAMEEHFRHCAACADESRRDEVLTRALAVPVAPCEVPLLALPSRGTAVSRRHARAALLLGAGAAAAALLLMIAGPLDHGGLLNLDEGISAPMSRLETPDFGMAHTWLSAGDPAGDVNRAMLSALALEGK